MLRTTQVQSHTIAHRSDLSSVYLNVLMPKDSSLVTKLENQDLNTISLQLDAVATWKNTPVRITSDGTLNNAEILNSAGYIARKREEAIAIRLPIQIEKSEESQLTDSTIFNAISLNQWTVRLIGVSPSGLTERVTTGKQCFGFVGYMNGKCYLYLGLKSDLED